MTVSIIHDVLWRHNFQFTSTLSIKQTLVWAFVLNSCQNLPDQNSNEILQSEVESSRTHFEVLGLGLEASSPRKLACPRLEDSSIFWIVKILWSAWKIVWKTFFCGEHLKNFCEDLFFYGDRRKNFCEDFFFWRALALVSLVLGLGLEHSCRWPRIFLSPWPWPRALCSRLHLCLQYTRFITSRCVTGWHDLSSCYWALAAQRVSKKCCSDVEGKTSLRI